MDINQIAAAAISEARTMAAMTAPAFDYHIAIHGIGGIFGELGNAAAGIAIREGLDVAATWASLQPELFAYEARCKARQYTGWSAAARSRGARIQYAAAAR
jgi:hypothetical protein